MILRRPKALSLSLYTNQQIAEDKIQSLIFFTHVPNTILYLFTLFLFRSDITLRLPVVVIDNSVNITMDDESETNGSSVISWILLLMILVSMEGVFITMFCDSPLKWVGMSCLIIYFLITLYGLRRCLKKICPCQRWKIDQDSSIKTDLCRNVFSFYFALSSYVIKFLCL